MEQLTLTTDMILVLALIGLAVLLFVTEWVRVDLVGIMMMVLTPFLGLVKPAQAFAGLSSNAVVSIIAVMIIGAGLNRTGLVGLAVKPVLKLSHGKAKRVMVLVSATVAGISSIMQNIGAAALFLPAVQRISRNQMIPISRLLMPIGFAAILGGTTTLVGSSPLILLNDLIEPLGLAPFGLFSVTPVGVCLVGAGIIYFLVLGPWVLPQGQTPPAEELCHIHPIEGRHFEAVVPEQLPQSLTAEVMLRRYGVHLVGLVKGGGGEKIMAPDGRSVLYSGDLAALLGKPEGIDLLVRDFGLEVKPRLEVFAGDLSPQLWGAVEAVVAPRSELEGKTLGQVHFVSKFRLNPLAVYRGDTAHEVRLEAMELKSGDSLLMEGPWERFRILAEKGWLIFCTPVREEPPATGKAAVAAVWLAVSLVLIMGFQVSLGQGLLTGALGMLVCRVIPVGEAYQAVDWRTIFLLAGLMPLGMATLNTGTAAWVAQETLRILGHLSPLAVLAVVGLLSTAFTLVVSNVGAVVLLVPIAVELALDAGADPRLAALAVGLATSNSFILPTHQVNALYMGPGRYHSLDFIKAGLPLSLVFLVVMLAVLYLLY
ncbi:MAG: SLC13 family permease [Desulfarculaceae bacterium]|nr:SLC13 family permease [Desulfarculaceae bacterium]MCF8072625.1 SLC13 family permease [Desulfarculaceae bacterium]MCF8103303.1 SLC13 family permease [Desulfarculaceae bacterium]MCF8117785.1 SLC13 family permease [Desulfarculaceae bacterium]